MSVFGKNIDPTVRRELQLACAARETGDFLQEFVHLENAHVLGQAPTYQHTKVHVLMLAWAIRQRRAGEVFGQMFRILGALAVTGIGMVPKGNTGGSSISPFKPLPLSEAHSALIDQAKSKR